MAASIVCGHHMNGWAVWKNINGESIDVYRTSINDESVEQNILKIINKYIYII